MGILNYYCTLFDQGYFLKGLAMIDSLQRQSREPWLLHVLAMDDGAYDALTRLNHPGVVPIRLRDFEDEELVLRRQERTFTEYCWTCTPALIRYCLNRWSLDHCTYLDADLYFFSAPEQLLAEVRESRKSVLITPHNYTSIFDQTRASGVFCVQFMYFQGSLGGRRVLEDWYQKCLAWCFNRVEEGRFGDQKYLDHWPSNFPAEVHMLRSHGSLAPWNVQRYSIVCRRDALVVESRLRREPVVFFHFHGINFCRNGSYFPGWYPLATGVKHLVYEPYFRKVQQLEADLLNRGFVSEFPKIFAKSKTDHSLKSKLKKFRNSILTFLYPLLRE
jgi:hypothetical protein